LLRDETLRILEQFEVRLDSGLDEQHLVDAGVIGCLIGAAGVERRDTVLEIGAGCGNITEALAGIAGKVFAVEKNAKFLPILEERTAQMDNVTLIHGDALRIRLPPFTRLVSNLPYSICEAVLNRLTRLDFERAAIVVSSSFAGIVSAREGGFDFSRLSLVANAFFEIEKLWDVSPAAYYPTPRGPTSIITIAPREVEEWSLDVLRGVLLRGRMKLKNALRESIVDSSREFGGPYTRREAGKLVESAGLGKALLEKRVARLSLRDLLLVRKSLKPSPS